MEPLTLPNNTQYVLLIGGRDSSGGAGITVDQLTAHELGQPALTICTAATIQSSNGVQAIEPISIAAFSAQLQQAFKQPLAAIKLGMLVNQQIIECLHQFLKTSQLPIVLDPVLNATQGGYLLEPDAISVLQHTLFPLASVITPNLPEAECILRVTLMTDQAIEHAARLLIEQGVQAVLIKGGHGTTLTSRDYLLTATNNAGQWFVKPRINIHLRGTGCRLATALACYLAQGQPLSLAVKHAQQFVYNCLHAAAHRKHCT